MAKESTKVFVKYIPRPGRPERTNIGGRFFNSNPRLEQSKFGDLIDVEFVERYRDSLEGAGCLIFDEEGVKKTVGEFLRSVPKDDRDDAKGAAKGLTGALAGADPEAELRLAAKRDAEEEKRYAAMAKKHPGKTLVPTLKMFVEAGYAASLYEHRFLGFKAGDIYDEAAIHENQKKRAEGNPTLTLPLEEGEGELAPGKSAGQLSL